MAWICTNTDSQVWTVWNKYGDFCIKEEAVEAVIRLSEQDARTAELDACIAELEQALAACEEMKSMHARHEYELEAQVIPTMVKDFAEEKSAYLTRIANLESKLATSIELDEAKLQHIDKLEATVDDLRTHIQSLEDLHQS